LVLAQALYQDGAQFDGAWNFGPRDEDAQPVQDVVNLLIKHWNGAANWKQDTSEQPHEAHSLKLDCSKAKQYLYWSPRWSVEQAIEKIAKWQSGFQESVDMKILSLEQIKAYSN